MNKLINYRPEIDGLRAIAVSAVIIYHAQIIIHNTPVLPGGFIGVDIFFVISGYLITLILLREMQHSTFTFIGFYERRIRRIIPALFCVIFLSIPFAWFFLLPTQFTEYAYSLISSVLFSSNLYFNYAGQQYAATSSLLIPFLHTWSLAVEEQYYIFFPIILFFCFKTSNKHTLNILIALTLISFILSNWLTSQNPSHSFYMIHTRCWELLIGSLVAKYEFDHGRNQHRPYYLNQLLPALGLILIAISTVLFHHNMFHPSFYTLLPVLGSTMIIMYCQKDGAVTKLLSNKLCVAIGLISYSLYLWHYPIFAFARVMEFTEGSIFRKLLLAIILLALSILSYYYVEQPFRKKTAMNRKKLFTLFLIASTTIITIAISIILNNGISQRFPELLQRNFYSKQKQEVAIDGRSCDNRFDNFCTFNKQATGRSVFLLGDSHMEGLLYPLKETLASTNLKLTNLTYAGFYVPKLTLYNRATHLPSTESNWHETRRSTLLNHDDAIVIIGGRLPLYLSEYYFDNQEGGIEGQQFSYYFDDANNASPDAKARQHLFKEHVKQAIYEIVEKGNKVILIYPIPEAGWDIPRKIKNLYFHNRDTFKQHLANNPITTSYQVFKQRTKSSFELLDSIQHPNIHRVYPHTFLCNTTIQNRCVTHDKHNMFYFDDDHLNIHGSKSLTAKIKETIDSIEQKH